MGDTVGTEQAAVQNQDIENGSDLLLKVVGKCVGHSTSHSVMYNTDTKDRAVKPKSTVGKSASLWKSAGITGLSIEIKADGLRGVNEEEGSFMDFAAAWGKGSVVEVECFNRGGSVYIKGSFVITSLEETNPAQDDATYSISLKNVGEPETYPGKSS